MCAWQRRAGYTGGDRTAEKVIPCCCRGAKSGRERGPRVIGAIDANGRGGNSTLVERETRASKLPERRLAKVNKNLE